MPNKLVSVIVTTKNNTATLDDCLGSIAKQTYQPIELVVVDNFSTDDTLQIAKKYTDKAYTKGPERCTQRNMGVAKAKGEYVAIIDSDMILSPHVVEQCVAAIEKNGAAGVVIPEESFGEGFWAQCKKLERSFYVGVPYMEAARFFRRETFRKAGGYDESLISGEDWDLSQRVEKLGKLNRVDTYIYHNEGRISLFKTIRKKYYYAQKFSAYQRKNPDSPKLARQTSPAGRYMLFLTRPGKLFKNPILGIGMLFMKSCEFSFGAAGQLIATLKGRRSS
jgi:glycosyltransferase involved in cell wall biosynthesis